MRRTKINCPSVGFVQSRLHKRKFLTIRFTAGPIVHYWGGAKMREYLLQGSQNCPKQRGSGQNIVGFMLGV